MKRLTTFLKKHKKGHIYVAIMLLLTALFHMFKGNKPLMDFLVDYITSPIKLGLATLCGLFPFSVAEVLLILAVPAALLYIIKAVHDIIVGREKWHILYRKFLQIFGAVLTVYVSFNLLWGINYYSSTFQEKSGIIAQPPTIDQLYQTTVYFTQRVNETGERVSRNEQGIFIGDRKELFKKSKEIYTSIEREFPFLKRKGLAAKPFYFSEVMSYADTTGFFFPFTAEANVNNHSPLCLVPSTIAHEIAHQRNIASEQDANFVAILSSVKSGEPEYEYSGYLLGYIHLSNALYSADQEKWQAVRAALSPDVQRDLTYVHQYWKKYETPVAEISQEINDNRLKDYGQEMGTRSYGAVVDLLVAYYGQ